jgi:hypothetical protein
MPPLTDIVQQPISMAPAVPHARPAHPSPTVDGLRLEVESARELGYHGQRFGIDVPYLMLPLGWGEWSPLVGT